eukprot:gene12379-biopygen6440
MPAPRPRHARATPAPPKPKMAYGPRHARAMPAPLSCDPWDRGLQSGTTQIVKRPAPGNTTLPRGSADPPEVRRRLLVPIWSPQHRQSGGSEAGAPPFPALLGRARRVGSVPAAVLPKRSTCTPAHGQVQDHGPFGGKSPANVLGPLPRKSVHSRCPPPRMLPPSSRWFRTVPVCV